MSAALNESIVEDAALTWFEELGHADGHGPQLSPGEPAPERDSFGKLLLVGRLRETFRRLKPSIHFDTLATFCDTLLRKLLNGKFSVGDVAVSV